MTIKQLMQYRAIKAEIALIKSRYNDLLSLSAVQQSGMPASGKVGKPTEEAALKLEELKKRYQKGLVNLLTQEKEILDFIEGIEDAELAAYVRAKYIEGKNEKEIYKMFRYERTTLPKRLRRYLKRK